MKNKIFGKTLTVAALALVLLAGMGIAGLLSYYGRIVGTATVEQSVKLWNGTDWMQCTPDYEACTIREPFDVVAGSQHENGPYYLHNNNEEVDAKVGLGTESDCGDGFRPSISMYMEVTGYETGGHTIANAFDWEHYKKYRYLYDAIPGEGWNLTTLNNIETITYKYMVPTESEGDHKPYVVLDLDTGADGIADKWVVEMVPPYAPSRNTWYKVTLNGEGTFHIPGDSECTQSSPCTFAKVKEKLGTATVLKTSIAFGAFPGTATYKAYGGIIQVDTFPTWLDTITVPADKTVIFWVIKEFAINMMPGTCDITTLIHPIL